MYYYLLYRRINRKDQRDFLWFRRYNEKPTTFEDDEVMFGIKIIESEYDMGVQIMKETWPEINVFDYGNLTYR